jgi:hypothetical protein
MKFQAIFNFFEKTQRHGEHPIAQKVKKPNGGGLAEVGCIDLGTTLLFLFYSKLGLSLVLAALIKKEPVWKGDKSWHVLLGHIIVTFGFIGLAYQGKRILCLDSL